VNPEDYAKKDTEHAHQVALFMWAATVQLSHPCLRWMYAVPNGGDRNPIVAARLKAEGVKSGVSDICLPFAARGYHGFYIEMKKPGGKESPTQKEFGAYLAPQNYLYRMCDHWHIARDSLLWYLGEGAPF
jgi:hypothetical protein